MSEQPTPETDAAERMAYAQEYMVPTDFARKLERERDEARELAQQMSDSNQVLMADVRFYRNAWEQIKEGAK
jgi:putative N-acetylmannosamine-6-phosphate epimerase